MRVYLWCDHAREELFREALGRHLKIAVLTERDLPRLVEGELVLADLAGEGDVWKNTLAFLRRGLDERIRILAVLNEEQASSLARGDPLDDFMLEGCSPGEMLARVRLLAGEGGEEAGAINFGELSVDCQRYEVRVSGKLVELTYKEFELLRFLAERPGKVFTREILLEQVWEYDYFGGSRTVDVHIRRIRSKIEKEGHTYIRTVRGVGYIFEHRPPE